MSTVWNDGWRCPKCGTEFTRANAVNWGLENSYDWASPLHNPLLCGECQRGACVPIGRNFTYDQDYHVRTYVDNGTTLDEEPYWSTPSELSCEA